MKGCCFVRQRIKVYVLIVTMIWLCGCSWFSEEVTAEKPLQTPVKDATAEYHVDEEEEVSYPEYRELVESDEPIEVVQVAETGGFAVSSSSAEATWAGMKVLSEGGNAVDAAVAVAYTLGVTEPYSSGLGGGGAMLVYDSTSGEARCLDYFSCAGNASVMQDEVAVPGFVKGMETALEMWGTISMAEAIEPALYYAENGFVATSEFLTRLGYYGALQYNDAFSDLKEGDMVVQSNLADSLRKIQQYGSDVFYNGEIAEHIAAKCALTTTDLNGYQVYEREALQTEAFGYTIYGSNTPTSGITLLQMLRMADRLNIASPEVDTKSYLTSLDTITQSAYASRRSVLVDAAYYEFDWEYYLSDEYIDSMLSGELADGVNDEEQICTTQFSVIDGNGLIVTVTNSLSNNWGSVECVDGFYLNNSLSLFVSSGKNAYEPGKRPRSYFAMAIAAGEDGSLFSIGSPGGKQIPRIVAPVMIDILNNGTDIQEAIDKARVFIDDDSTVCLETEDRGDSLIDISQCGRSYYYSNSHLYFGCTSVVSYSPDTGVNAYADRRRSGSQALVYHYDS